MRKIKKKLTITDQEKIPFLYAFNYDSGGYVIVSADKRLRPVLAFSDIVKFNLDSLPGGISQWMGETARQIKEFRKAQTKPNKYIVWEWSKMLSCPPEPTPYATKRLKIASCDDTPPDPNAPPVIITVTPLLSTLWSQGCFFNSYCPLLSDGPCGYAHAGCSTVATAQIMYYYKYPATYNWSAMSLTQGNEPVARLIGDIFPNVIDKDEIDAGGSSCTNDYNITHTFFKFGYHYASLAGYVNGVNENGGYSFEIIVNNLKTKKPVILGAFDDYVNILGLFSYPTGTGHLWVCDGYEETNYTYASYLYLHMNWGWYNGKYNGWYAYNDWTSPNGGLNYFKDIIYNIQP